MTAGVGNTTGTNTRLCVRVNQEVFGQGKVELADELIGEDFVEHEAPPGTPPGPDAVKRVVGWIHSALSDIHYDVEDAFEAGDRVALRLTLHARHTGEFFGVPATGKPISMKQIHIFRVEDGKIREHWGARDDAGVMRQIRSEGG